MTARKPPPPSYVCPACKLRSYHPVDVAEKYCARCGVFEADRPLIARAAAAGVSKRGGAR